MHWIRARDRAGRVLAVPSQAAGVLASTGLTPEEVEREAWAIEPAEDAGDARGQGRRAATRYAGAAAINRVLAELGGPWSTLARAYWLPGIRQVEDASYRWVTRNRHALSWLGTTPECDRPQSPCKTDRASSTRS